MPAPKAAGGASGDAGRTWLRTEPRAALVRRIVGVALPVAAASVVAPLFGLIDAFSIPRLLQQAGDAAGAAMADFGVYNRGVALLQLVLMAASGASAALVPALTAARSVPGGENAAPAAGQAAFALRLAWWFGSAAAVGLALLAVPIDIALFSDDAGSSAIALLAPAALFGSLQAVSAGLLQGRGDLRSPAVNLAAAAVFKLSLNVLLVPAWGIAGAAAGMTAAYAAAAVLNALSLRRRMKLPGFKPDSAWRPAAALAAMAAAVRLAELALGALTRGMPDRAAALLVALPGVGIGAAVFAAALAAARAIGPQEWREIPGCSAGSRLDRCLGWLWNRASKAAKEG
jgi:O-antigen/teichoic acid export membrane protein